MCAIRSIRLEVPPKQGHKRPQHYDRELYRKRNMVERLINRLKRHRRIATRYEKRAANFAAMLSIACNGFEPFADTP